MREKARRSTVVGRAAERKYLRYAWRTGSGQLSAMPSKEVDKEPRHAFDHGSFAFCASVSGAGVPHDGSLLLFRAGATNGSNDWSNGGNGAAKRRADCCTCEAG